MSNLRVGDEVRIVQGYQFGKTGRVTAVLTPEQTRESNGFTHAVEIRLWNPIVVQGDGIAEIDEATPETIAAVQASGEPFEIDSGLHPWGFRKGELKSLRDSQEPFWALYEEREQAHHRETRRRANRACNRWRCHKEEQAVELARSCHPINLLLSATDSPPNFKGLRLCLDKCVALCRAADKTEEQLADLLFHMFFENRPVYKVGGITARCTCTLN